MDNTSEQNGSGGKLKLSLRPGPSVNSWEKSPPTSAKLMLSHGKPNFTIPRPPKPQNGCTGGSGETNGICSSVAKTNGWTPGKVPLCNGSAKASTWQRSRPMASSASEPHVENEMAKVVLRRTNILTSNGDDLENEHAARRNEEPEVPEFIRRQRQIQERLAKENILDFEKRRSGYFTHFVITPTSPQRQSFAETMSSPAIVPALEIPPPASTPASHNGAPLPACLGQSAVASTIDEAGDVGEEEVAKAIEAVNRAVAGEDDDCKSNEESFSRAAVEEEIVSLISDAMNRVSVNGELAPEEPSNSISGRSGSRPEGAAIVE